MYTAAEATARIRDVIDAAAGAESVSEGDDDQAAQRRAVAAAAANLRAVAEHAARTLREILDVAATRCGDGRRAASRLVQALIVLELRADPLGRDVRLLLAVEPADAVMLLAVLDGEDAIAEHRSQAIQLAGDLLSDIRAGTWPPADAASASDLELTFADAATFLERFFPAASGAIAERAAALPAAQLPGRPAHQQRRQHLGTVGQIWHQPGATPRHRGGWPSGGSSPRGRRLRTRARRSADAQHRRW